MIIRLRSRDGLERVEVPDQATIQDLHHTIHDKLGIPLHDLTLSKESALLTSKDGGQSFIDLSLSYINNATLASSGVHHGDMLFMLYTGERHIPGGVRSDFERRPFGAHMDIDAMIAAQTRIERQENPVAKSVSFDRYAVNAFQSYVANAIAFSIKRGGVLYGTVGEEEGVLSVEAIWEPPQQGAIETLVMERGIIMGGDNNNNTSSSEQQYADYIAKGLGLTKVGWIFNQAMGSDRDYIFNSEELRDMAAVQAEMGQHAVTAVVVNLPGEEEGDPPEVHVEAFQVSQQCVKLYQQGWVQDPTEPTGTTLLRNPKEPKNERPVILNSKDVGEVDNDFFLVPVPILDHEGPLQSSFPVENRLFPGQSATEMKQHIQSCKSKGVNYMSDFHFLLYLAKQANFGESDLEVILECVKSNAPVPEGYQIIIDSMAGL